MSEAAITQRTGWPTGLLLLILVGGTAVLASYVWGAGEPDFTTGMWGGVPESLKPLYTVSMFLAAGGFFPMTAYVLLRLWRNGATVGEAGFAPLTACYGMILIASAAWVPLTLLMLRDPSDAMWLAVRGVLFVAAFGSLGVLSALFKATTDRGTFWKLALAGCVLFCNQTVLLDALIWPYFFPTGS